MRLVPCSREFEREGGGRGRRRPWGLPLTTWLWIGCAVWLGLTDEARAQSAAT